MGVRYYSGMTFVMKHYYDRIEGALLGLAVGDALGVPAEFRSREELRAAPITGMVGGGEHGQLPGTWSDDTSMTLCMVDSLTARGIDFEDQMQRFADWLWNASNTARGEVFDVGGATREAILRHAKKTPATACGCTAENACGNGSLMRMAPLALYLWGQYRNLGLDDRAAELIHRASQCTHAHPRCQMACGIYCAVIFELFRCPDRQSAVRLGILNALSYYRKKPEFAAVWPEFASLERIGEWTEDEVESSGYVIHTLQAALWCLYTTSSYAECVLRAVNLGEDADTTAAVAGALAGICYKAREIPRDWLEQTARWEEIRQRAKPFYYACLKDGRAGDAGAYTPR